MITVFCDACNKVIEKPQNFPVWKERESEMFSIRFNELCLDCHQELDKKVRATMEGMEEYHYEQYLEVYHQTMAEMTAK